MGILEYGHLIYGTGDLRKDEEEEDDEDERGDKNRQRRTTGRGNAVHIIIKYDKILKTI